MDLRYFILAPEVVAYCEIQYSKITLNDTNVFYRMVSVRRLFLPRNHMEEVYDSMFAAMSQLVVLDLSHNLIKYLPQITLCPLHNLQYIALHHNLIAELSDRAFVNNPNVQVLLLESNNLKPELVVIDAIFPSLCHLSSDIPRLCCALKLSNHVSPPSHYLCHAQI